MHKLQVEYELNKIKKVRISEILEMRTRSVMSHLCLTCSQTSEGFEWMDARWSVSSETPPSSGCAQEIASVFRHNSKAWDVLFFSFYTVVQIDRHRAVKHNCSLEHIRRSTNAYKATLTIPAKEQKGYVALSSSDFTETFRRKISGP